MTKSIQVTLAIDDEQAIHIFNGNKQKALTGIGTKRLRAFGAHQALVIVSDCYPDHSLFARIVVYLIKTGALQHLKNNMPIVTNFEFDVNRDASYIRRLS